MGPSLVRMLLCCSEASQDVFDVRVFRRGALLADLVLQVHAIVHPDARPQVTEQFEDGQCLFGRPMVGNEEVESALDAGRQVGEALVHERFSGRVLLRLLVRCSARSRASLSR